MEVVQESSVSSPERVELPLDEDDDEETLPLTSPPPDVEVPDHDPEDAEATADDAADDMPPALEDGLVSALEPAEHAAPTHSTIPHTGHRRMERLMRSARSVPPTVFCI
jgi:hypothetical protein